MTGGGPFRLKPGIWTDDTAMALALADSLVTCGKLDAVDLMARFVRWWEHGEYSCTGECFDIGNITRESLERFIQSGNPYAGPIHERSAGNGSLMRIAPVAIYALQDEQLAVGYAREQSRTTHGAPVAVEACALFTLLLREAIERGSKDVLERRPWKGHGTIRSIAAGEWKTKSRNDISSSGYVVATLEAALWCVDQTNSFEEALVLAVNLADDADTVGAVTGQLAGALYGASSIPDRWLQPLAWRERIEATALDLLRASTQRPSDRA
jgi:ADP-ribosyl-[dinitrogen reductase] hydrolase